MEELRQQDWDRQTFVRFAELVKKVPPEELGIEARFLNDRILLLFRSESSDASVVEAGKVLLVVKIPTK